MNTQSIGRKRKELLAITLLLNVAAIGWGYFLFMEIKEKNEHLSELANRIEAETAEESDIHYKKNLAVETATLREKLLSSTLAKGGAISFIELLEATGRDVGARTSIESVSTKDNAKLSNIEELRLALKVTGPWPAVVRLLGLLELLPYETELDQVVVSKVESPEEGSWRADLLLTTLKEK